MLFALFCFSGCAARGPAPSLATGPHPILVGPISEGIFQHHLWRAEAGDLTSIDVVIAYYYNNGLAGEALKWEHFRELAAKGRLKGRWAHYRP